MTITIWDGAIEGATNVSTWDGAAEVPITSLEYLSFPPVEFTTTGATFSPSIELRPDAESSITWRDNVGAVLATGLNPVINFGTAATRTVIMDCDNPDDVTVINLGFDNAQDLGEYAIGTAYNKAPELVTGVVNLPGVRNLRYFCAANGPLTGHLDLHGLTYLTFVECYRSNVTSIDVTGCTSMIRLNIEENALVDLDLNPVAATLRDLRAAAQAGAALTLAPMTVDLAALYHYCVRDQLITNPVPLDRMPVVEQYWNWHTSATGPLVPISPELKSVLSYGNDWTSADFSGCGQDASIMVIRLAEAPLTSIDVTGRDVLASLRLEGVTTLSSTAMDDLLVEINSWGTSGGTLLAGEAAVPSATGLAAADALVGRGWTVSIKTEEGPGGDPGALLWEDTFDRANGAPGAPWLTPLGGSVASISSNALLITGGSGYQRVWAMPTEDLAGVTNYQVEIEFNGTPSAMTWFGVCFRMDDLGNGAKVLFQTNALAAPRCGLASSSGSEIAVASGPGLPASWSQQGVHTLAARANGNTITVLCDGQEAWSSTHAANAGSGSGVGFCGQSQSRSWNSIRVTNL